MNIKLFASIIFLICVYLCYLVWRLRKLKYIILLILNIILLYFVITSIMFKFDYFNFNGEYYIKNSYFNLNSYLE